MSVCREINLAGNAECNEGAKGNIICRCYSTVMKVQRVIVISDIYCIEIINASVFPEMNAFDSCPFQGDVYVYIYRNE